MFDIDANITEKKHQDTKNETLILFFAGGNRWQWSRRKIEHDSTLLQGHFYQKLQENHWRRLPRETYHVSE